MYFSSPGHRSDVGVEPGCPLFPFCYFCMEGCKKKPVCFPPRSLTDTWIVSAALEHKMVLQNSIWDPLAGPVMQKYLRLKQKTLSVVFLFVFQPAMSLWGCGEIKDAEEELARKSIISATRNEKWMKTPLKQGLPPAAGLAASILPCVEHLIPHTIPSDGPNIHRPCTVSYFLHHSLTRSGPAASALRRKHFPEPAVHIPLSASREGSVPATKEEVMSSLSQSFPARERGKG